MFHLNGELFKKNNFDKDIDYMLSDFFFFHQKIKSFGYCYELLKQLWYNQYKLFLNQMLTYLDIIALISKLNCSTYLLTCTFKDLL